MSPIAIPVIALAETASTNDEAMSRALGGTALPFWVTADRQTAGRGRSGRSWASNCGNLHASLALPVACEPRRIAELSLVAGVAVAEYLRAAAAQTVLPADSIRLKWPNDIMIADPASHRWAKAGGILIESSALPMGGGRFAVIGIGLNLVVTPDITDRPTTSLAAHGLYLGMGEVVAGLSQRLVALVDQWLSEPEPYRLLTRWQACATPVGQYLTVNAGDVVVSGRFAGLAADGALLLEDEEGRQRRFTFADVTLGPA